MTAFERRTKILDYLQREKRASTKDLSEQFQVSEVTIRHDLAELAEQGWIARVHGGAAVVQQPEQSLSIRETIHQAEKARIARAAVELIRPGDRLALDSSTTALQLAREIRQRPSLTGLTIVTYNLQAAMTLATSPGIDVMIVGGFVRGETWSVTGPSAEAMIAGIHVNKGFFGAAGVTIQRGLTDADMREVQVKRALMRATADITVLLDSSKFGMESFSTTLKLDKVQRVITDAGISPEYREALRPFDLELQIV
ncbi:MAG: DeoR/GlpR transcriptional regulator [Anaerolineae bacterium]|nr:DeoR/GlpR transcriptional regulator [Anaerolineae bacterium]